MSNLSNSMGEGGAGGRAPGGFTDTGYGTHDGRGNVPTGAPFQKGTGYDAHGQVATEFGKWSVGYDPVTGMAVDNVTSGYDFPPDGGPAGGMAPVDVSAGLVDVSAAAAGHSTSAPPEVQRQLQEFFERRGQQQQPEAAAAAARVAPAQPDSAAVEGAGEATGQGTAERMDAGQYLPGQPELTGHEAESWRDRRQTDPETAGLERPPAHRRTGA